MSADLVVVEVAVMVAIPDFPFAILPGLFWPAVAHHGPLVRVVGLQFLAGLAVV